MESENKAIERVTVDRRIKQMTDEEILAEKAKFQNAGDDEMFRPLTIAIAFDISASYLQRLRCEGGGPAYQKFRRAVMYKKSSVVKAFAGRELEHTSMEAT